MKAIAAVWLMSQALSSGASNPYFPGPESFPDNQSGYVCLITDYVLPEEVYGLGFALSKEPDCGGGTLLENNVACPLEMSGRDNPYVCGHRRFTPSQLQMLQDLLLSASERNLRVTALRGECQVEGTPKQTCFYSLTVYNFKPPSGGRVGQKNPLPSSPSAPGIPR